MGDWLCLVLFFSVSCFILILVLRVYFDVSGFVGGVLPAVSLALVGRNCIALVRQSVLLSDVNDLCLSPFSRLPPSLWAFLATSASLALA